MTNGGSVWAAALWWPANAVQAIALVLWSVFWITTALVVGTVTRSPRGPLALAHRMWAPGALALGGARLQVVGAERLDRSRHYLFVANHESYFDIPALYGAVPLPLRFVARSGLGRVPFIGTFIRAMGMILVDRSARSAATVERASSVLTELGSLITFPEATRSRGGELGSFKTGAIVPSILAGVPVVPVAIDGAYEVLRPGGIALRPGTIRVTICPPIATDGLSADDRHALTEQVRSAIAEVLETGKPDRPG